MQTVYGTLASNTSTPYTSLALRVLWVWAHLLYFDISNQSFRPEDDLENKPWRPIPSNRISQEDACTLRWILLFVCFSLSSMLGVPVPGIVLYIGTFCHHELGFHNHWFSRAVCMAVGYTCFNAGASGVMCGTETSIK